MKSNYKPIVIATLIGLGIVACTKKGSPGPETAQPVASFTSHIGGSRNWHGYFKNYNSYKAYPDTTFAITVLSDSAINIWGDIFIVDSVDSTRGVIFFGVPKNTWFKYYAGSYLGTYSAWSFYVSGRGFGVAYFFSRDSVTFVRGVYDHNQSYSDVWHTY